MSERLRLNSLKPNETERRKRDRVGRGCGSTGKTAGRGHKGQKSRSGSSIRPGFEGGQMPLQKRVPKFGAHSRLAKVTGELRVESLNRLEADEVTLETLQEAGLVARHYKRVKIFSVGKLTKAFTVKGIQVSKGATVAIEEAGGKIIKPDISRPAKLTKKEAVAAEGKATKAKKETKPTTPPSTAKSKAEAAEPEAKAEAQPTAPPPEAKVSEAKPTAKPETKAAEPKAESTAEPTTTDNE